MLFILKVADKVNMAFNSLFEMHGGLVPAVTVASAEAFNSLFEMRPPKCSAYAPKSLIDLSILYLRCASDAAERAQHRRHRFSFNSLFEMRKMTPKPREEDKKEAAFNSLFEMPIDVARR